MKTCSACKIAKPLEDFPRSRKASDGRHPHCKKCTSEKHRNAYAERGRDSWLNDSVCVRCKKLLPKIAYRIEPGGRRHPKCPECENEVARQEANGLKECNICRQWLALADFYLSKVHLPRAACAECTRKQTRSYRPTRRVTELMREYGITLEQYDELVSKQGGKCPVCAVPFEPGNYSYTVDHAHGGAHKGRIRAITHDVCNRHVLWAHDDSTQLRRAADIIDNPLTDWYVPKPTTNESRWKGKQK